MQSWEGAWRRFSPIKRPILDFCHFLGLVGEPFSIVGLYTKMNTKGAVPQCCGWYSVFDRGFWLYLKKCALLRTFESLKGSSILGGLRKLSA